jgi:hypothetical protein
MWGGSKETKQEKGKNDSVYGVYCTKCIMSYYIMTSEICICPICVFNKYAVGYEVYHHPAFVLIALYSIDCECKRINFNVCKLRIYAKHPHFCGHV